jgi:hypothetical protein
MYKNFKITEEEKKQILESHMSHGYKKPLNNRLINENEPTNPKKEQVFMSKFFNGPIENFEDEIGNLFRDVEDHFTSYDGIDDSYYTLLKMVIDKIDQVSDNLRIGHLEKEPSDDDIYNQSGSEGGVSYGGGGNFQGR